MFENQMHAAAARTMNTCLRHLIEISLKPFVAVMTGIDIENVEAGGYSGANADK